MTKTSGEYQPSKPISKAEREARKAFREVDAVNGKAETAVEAAIECPGDHGNIIVGKCKRGHGGTPCLTRIMSSSCNNGSTHLEQEGMVAVARDDAAVRERRLVRLTR